MNPMPPPDMPPSIQKPQNFSPNCLTSLVDQRFGVEIRTPGDDRLAAGRRSSASSLRRSPARRRAQRGGHFVEHAHRLLPAAPFRSPRSRYFSVTISRIGPTFWAMPP